MIDPGSATLAITTISSAVGLVDKVFDTWAKFRRTGEVKVAAPSDHYEKIAATPNGDSLVHTTDGDVANIVTRDQLASRLTRAELTVLEAIEKRMDFLVAQWSEITSAFETLTPAQKGVSKVQLNDICRELSNCLSTIMSMLETVGFQLQDHYGAVKMIAQAH